MTPNTNNSHSLPEDQEKLLRTLNEIDTLERQNILPERSNINLFLIGFVWTLGILVSIASIVNDRVFILNQIIIACGLASVGLMGSYYNKKWGDYLSTVIILLINGFLTYNTGNYHSDFVILIDGLTIFLIANQFGKNGFVFAALLILAKITGIFYMYRGKGELEDYFANIISVLAIGVLPVFIRAVSQVSRAAKKQEIRAGILALQNQDLISSWQGMFQPSAPAAPSAPKAADQSKEVTK